MAPMFSCIIWVITVNMDLILIEIVENCGIPRTLRVGTFWSIFGKFWDTTKLAFFQQYEPENTWGL